MLFRSGETSDDELKEQILGEFEHIEVLEMDNLQLEKHVSNDLCIITQFVYLKYKEIRHE